jgi:hypothetical protein
MTIAGETPAFPAIYVFLTKSQWFIIANFERSIFMHEDLVEQEEMTGDEKVQEEKLVPVAESIRYRKRAQAAETKLEEMTRAYEEQGRQMEQFAERMASAQIDQRLREQLVSAQAVDVETAMLVAKQRLEGVSVEGDSLNENIQTVVEQLGQDKPFLFGQSVEVKEVGTPERYQISGKTQGVKRVRSDHSNRVLQEAAESAVASGSRGDVQEYLRVKRQVV